MFSVPCPKCGRDREFRQLASAWVARKSGSSCHTCAGMTKRPGVRLTEEQIQQALSLHKEKKTNRAIARELGVHHHTIAAILKKHGLECNGTKRKRLERLGNGLARCSRCHQPKPETEFTVNRRGKKYEYVLSYCFECRHQQQYDNLNSDTELYLNDRWHKMKVRAKQKGVSFTVTKNHLYELFARQEGKCFYTDVPLRCRVGEGYSRNAFSVDRVDSTLGYDPDNIVLCTYKANTVKTDITLEEMKEWMPGWYARVQKFLKERVAKTTLSPVY